jgi:hypothetical protein
MSFLEKDIDASYKTRTTLHLGNCKGNEIRTNLFGPDVGTGGGFSWHSFEGYFFQKPVLL